MQPTTTNAAYYRHMAKRYLERPPTPPLAALAIPFYQKAIALAPDELDSYFELASAYRELGEIDLSRTCCEQALAYAPDSLVARYYRCMLQLPMIYRTQAEVSSARLAYTQALDELQALIACASPTQLHVLAEAIGRISPYYLQYQAQDDRPLMERYGRLITGVMGACYPQWSQHSPTRPLTRPPAPGQPIRLGIVSGLFYQHSVWKDVIKGWVSQLDPCRFTLLGYSYGKTQDGETEAARAYFTRSHDGKFVTGEHSLTEWAALIQADQPHLLIYPEVTMRKLSIQLAALRLAPVQATTWASYVTSGLPTMDYFLSGDLIEPAAAAQHYSEELVRLPNTSIYYTPLTIAPEEKPKTAFGLRPAAIVYFCGQALFKYLPQYDCIYPQIAQALAKNGIDCQFVFLKSSVSEPASKFLEKRLATAFAALGLDHAQHVVLLSRLTDGAYHRLNQLADIFLDSIGVSGATTTLEALAYDLPIVTLRGDFLRGSVSAGILRQLGISDTIATSFEHYLALAINLGQDEAWRHAIRQQMAANKQHFYADHSPIRGLESFIERVVHQPCVA